MIRARYDRHITRWMPHITMAYPFRPREEYDAVTEALAAACRSVPAFTLELARFFSFGHGRESYTLWLEPEPREPLLRLQAALAKAVPDCDDVERYEFGFTPHLSVGQAKGEATLAKLREQLQAGWQPVSFRVTEISLVWRNEPPDDIFRVDRTIHLGE
jgi:2'-5' RNA ligase